MKIVLTNLKDRIAAEAEIPSFDEIPVVLGWKDRVFRYLGKKYHTQGDKSTGGEVPIFYTYKECFAYAVVPANITKEYDEEEEKVESEPVDEKEEE